MNTKPPVPPVYAEGERNSVFFIKGLQYASGKQVKTELKILFAWWDTQYAWRGGRSGDLKVWPARDVEHSSSRDCNTSECIRSQMMAGTLWGSESLWRKISNQEYALAKIQQQRFQQVKEQEKVCISLCDIQKKPIFFPSVN